MVKIYKIKYRILYITNKSCILLSYFWTDLTKLCKYHKFRALVFGNKDTCTYCIFTKHVEVTSVSSRLRARKTRQPKNIEINEQKLHVRPQ